MIRNLRLRSAAYGYNQRIANLEMVESPWKNPSENDEKKKIEDEKNVENGDKNKVEDEKKQDLGENNEKKDKIKSPWEVEKINENKEKIAININSKKTGQNGGSGGGNGGNNKGKNFNSNDFFDKFGKSPKKIGGLIFLAIIAFWLALGFYKVDSDENAIILYFGKFNSVATPGLNYHIPAPIGKVIKQSVTSVNSEEFGKSVGEVKRNKKRQENSANLMLTGDENIVDIEFQVQWQIKDIEQFTFNVSDPRLTIRSAAESAMREIIAKTPISEALSDGKSKIEQSAKDLLQQTLDSYKTGVRVILVQLRRVDPPMQVIDAFRDVQTAKADKEREINEAQAYANDIIPRARGGASQMTEEALAYKEQVMADAEGEASRFLALYSQYKKSKELTRKRIYLETMGKVYGDVDKVIIDKKAAQNVVFPYFPTNEQKK